MTIALSIHRERLKHLDVAALLREVGRNQDEIEKRVSEYAFKQTETDREINGKGELKKETVKVYEVFPLPNREPVQKLISENGVPLSAERAAKEDRRVQEEFLKAEREKEKDEKKVAQRRAEREKKSNEGKEGTEISPFLKACEFVSPRREMLAGRETIVFDFRPRPGFQSTEPRGEFDCKVDRRRLDRSGRQASDPTGSASGGRFQDGRWLAGFTQARSGARDGTNANGRGSLAASLCASQSFGEGVVVWRRRLQQDDRVERLQTFFRRR